MSKSVCLHAELKWMKGEKARRAILYITAPHFEDWYQKRSLLRVIIMCGEICTGEEFNQFF